MTCFTTLRGVLLALVLSCTPMALFAESPGSSKVLSANSTSQASLAEVNINTASAEELADGLSGVGLKRAEAIIQYRTQNGSFTTKDQLMDVKGIGEAVFEKNEANISL